MAKKLKDGDVTDRQFSYLILRELDDLKSKIDFSLARKDLLASLRFYGEGIVFLYQVFEQQEAGKQKMLKLIDLEQIAKQSFLNAKVMFKDARRRAIDAFSDEALKTSDRLLAMKIRISATIMENIDCPAIALESCKLCLEELHKMPVVLKCFSVEITKSVRFWFKKNERRELIASVYQMNYEVHRVTRIVRDDLRDQIELPFITINHQQINPLRDARLNEALKEFKLEHCMLEWTFGSEEELNYTLFYPFGITTSTSGRFVYCGQ